MRRVILATAALLVFAAVGTWLIDLYVRSIGTHWGFHGLLATFLCLVFIPGTTIGLMQLTRFSRDKGFDDRADTYVRDHHGGSDEGSGPH